MLRDPQCSVERLFILRSKETGTSGYNWRDSMNILIGQSAAAQMSYARYARDINRRSRQGTKSTTEDLIM
jgi:hypothetical protein